MSTGEFLAGEDADATGGVLAAALLRRPSEILVSEALRGGGALLTRLQDTGAALTFVDPAAFASRRAPVDLAAHFGVASLDAFGIGHLTLGLQAAAAALAYVRATQGERLGHVSRLARLTPADCLTLDETAVETLELLRAADGGVRHALIGALDHTVTPSPTNELGVKGIGEAGTIAASAAVINAICDALSPLGNMHVDMRRSASPTRATWSRCADAWRRSTPCARPPARSTRRSARRRGRRWRISRTCARCSRPRWWTSRPSRSATAA